MFCNKFGKINLSIMLLAVLAFSMLSASYAYAADSYCGGDIPCSCVDGGYPYINESRTFNESDYLVGCSSGLLITRDDVVLDCDGYNISSDGTYGIDVQGDRVTIKNCKINGYGYGIASYGYVNMTIKDNEITNSSDYGIYIVSNSNGNTITGNTITGISIYDGILISNSDSNTISKNNISDNNAYGIEIIGAGTSNHVIDDNTISYNGYSGIHIEDEDMCTISDNRIFNNGLDSSTPGEGAGIYLENSENMNFTNNDIYDNCLGAVIADSSYIDFKDNEISYSDEECGYEGSGIGLLVAATEHMTMDSDYLHDNDYAQMVAVNSGSILSTEGMSPSDISKKITVTDGEGDFWDEFSSLLLASNVKIERDEASEGVVLVDSLVGFIDSTITQVESAPRDVTSDITGPSRYDYLISGSFLVLEDTPYDVEKVYLQSGGTGSEEILGLEAVPRISSAMLARWSLKAYVESEDGADIKDASVTFTTHAMEYGTEVKAIESDVEQVEEDIVITETTDSDGMTPEVPVNAKLIYIEAGPPSISDVEPTVYDFVTTVTADYDDYSDSVDTTPTEQMTVDLTLPFTVFRKVGGSNSNGYQPTVPNVYDVDGNLVSTGTTDLTGLKIGDSFTWTIDGETHTGKIISIGAGYVVIQISSDPQDVKVLIGETKQVDVDGDGIMDISVTLNGITGGKPDLTIVDLTWTTPPAAEMPPAATPPAAQPGAPPAAQPTGQPGTQPAADYTMIIVVVILAIAAGLWYYKKRK